MKHDNRINYKTEEVTPETEGFEEIDSSLGESYIDEQPTVEPIYGEVFNCSSVNVRENASPTAKILAQLNAGSKVEIIGSENEFHHVVTSTGLAGYIMKQFICL